MSGDGTIDGVTPGFVVRYHDRAMPFYPLSDRSGQFIYKCPTGAHRAFNWIDLERPYDNGTRHVLKSNVDGCVTIEGSLACPQGCGWHVHITDGVAVDC
jgi:hypothetical protein